MNLDVVSLGFLDKTLFITPPDPPLISSLARNLRQGEQ